jgi:hypothetical protein
VTSVLLCVGCSFDLGVVIASDERTHPFVGIYIIIIRALDRCYHYTVRIGVEICNRAALCEGINGHQPPKPSKFRLLEASTRSEHGRAGATGSVRHKPITSNSDIDLLEKRLTYPKKFARY